MPNASQKAASAPRRRLIKSATESPLTPKAELSNAVCSYAYDPEGFAHFAYPWGEGELEGIAGPRKFQLDIPHAIKAHTPSR